MQNAETVLDVLRERHGIVTGEPSASKGARWVRRKAARKRPTPDHPGAEPRRAAHPVARRTPQAPGEGVARRRSASGRSARPAPSTVAMRTASAAIALLIGGRPDRFGSVHLLRTSWRCQRRMVLGVTRRWQRSARGSRRTSAANTARSAYSRRGLGWVRWSTATSCRSTRSSMSLVQDVPPISRTRPSMCWKIKYWSRTDTAEIMPGRPRSSITAGHGRCSIVEPHRFGEHSNSVKRDVATLQERIMR